MICGLTGAEILMLDRWRDMMRLPREEYSEERPFADVMALRRQWIEAGGTFPVREWDILFVRPREKK